MAKKQGKFELSYESRDRLHTKLSARKSRPGEKLPSYDEFVYKEGVAKKFLERRAGVKEAPKKGGIQTEYHKKRLAIK